MQAESAPSTSSTVPDGTPLEAAASVISCSRLGRTANPPTFSLTDWLRPRRRRYGSVSGA
jgi:hypothetical protein